MIPKLTRENYCYKLTYCILAICLVSLPFTRWLMLPSAFLLLLCQLTDGRFRQKWQLLCERKSLFALVAISGLFLASLIATTYAPDFGAALSDWECKIWFLVAPLCILPYEEQLRGSRLHRLLMIFCAATLFCSFGNMIWSATDFLRTHETQAFWYGHATHFIGAEATHPSYLSMYCAVAWAILVHPFQGRSLNRWGKALRWAGIILLPIEIVLLESKAGWFVLVFVILMEFIYRMSRRRQFVLLAALCVILSGGAAAVLLHTERTKVAIEALKHGDRSDPTDGTLQRVVVWETAKEEIAHHLPWGTGTGSSRDVLCQSYEVHGYTHILAKRLNCHNQYLQSTLEQGIIGIVALTVFLLFLFSSAIRKRNYLLGLFLAVIALNFLVESMIEARAGSNFIPLLATLLYVGDAPTHCEGMSE